MQISFDWPNIYERLVSQRARLHKSAFDAAWRLENDIFAEGWPTGAVFGDQSALIDRYGLSRATLREAVRLLEDRHVAQMRRGPGGGLVVLSMSGGAIAAAVADYFRSIEVTALHVQQAWAALQIVTAYHHSAAAGANALDAFTREFRGKLTDGPGAGLLGPGSRAFCSPVRTVGGHPMTDLFAACLHAYETEPEDDGGGEERTRSAANRLADSPLIRSRAHELARRLTLELPRAPADGAPWSSTEDQLCERYAVGRDVLRQAIRVLESRGLIECKRGRTHGVQRRRTDAAPSVDLVVTYFSAARLTSAEFFQVASMLSRIVRMVVAAESTRLQRQELLRRFECARGRSDAPTLVTSQLQSEWSSLANPILMFMEKCSTAYHARAGASFWARFDPSQMRRLPKRSSYMEAVARGKLAEADSLVERACHQVSILRGAVDPSVKS